MEVNPGSFSETEAFWRMKDEFEEEKKECTTDPSLYLSLKSIIPYHPHHRHYPNRQPSRAAPLRWPMAGRGPDTVCWDMDATTQCGGARTALWVWLVQGLELKQRLLV